jgi:hypothetical protein
MLMEIRRFPRDSKEPKNSRGFEPKSSKLKGKGLPPPLSLLAACFVFLSLLLSLLLFAAPLGGNQAEAEEVSSPVLSSEASPNVSSNIPSGKLLFQALQKQFSPEEMTMIIDEEPREDGRVRHIYMDLTGPRLGGVRIEKLAVEAWDVKFNPVEEWSRPVEDPLEVEEVLHTYAEGVITEVDLNEDLLQKKFGDEKDWRDLYLDFTPQGLHAQGKYRVKFLFTFDMLIEIYGVLGLRKGQEIWLEDYHFKVNKVNVPESLTRSAVEELQPLLDLGRYMFPLKLQTLEMDNEKVLLQSSTLPQPFEGVRYKKENNSK